MNRIISCIKILFLTICILLWSSYNNKIYAGASCLKSETIATQTIVQTLYQISSSIKTGDIISNYNTYIDMTGAEGDNCSIPSDHVNIYIPKAIKITFTVSGMSDAFKRIITSDPKTYFVDSKNLNGSESYSYKNPVYYLRYTNTVSEIVTGALNPYMAFASLMFLKENKHDDLVCVNVSPPIIGQISEYIGNQTWSNITSLNIGCKYTKDQKPQNFKTYVSALSDTPNNNQHNTKLPPAPIPGGTQPNQMNTKIIIIGNCLSNDEPGMLFSIFYPVVKCISQASNILFIASSSSPALSEAFRIKLAPFAVTMLIISVIIFGMKTALGAVHKKNDIIMFFIKFAFVASFTLSTTFPNYSTTGADSNLSGSQFIKIFATSMTDSLVSLASSLDLSKADNNSSFSSFIKNNIINSTDKVCTTPIESDNISYSLFAMLDCKLSYYLGIVPDVIIQKTKDIIPSKGSLTSDEKSKIQAKARAEFHSIKNSLLGLSLPSLLSFFIIYAVLGIVFILLLFSVFATVVHVYCISLICQSLLIILTPLIVPCLLFNYTKGFFDSWIRLILSFTLQPMIYAFVLILMMTMYDRVLFGDCIYDQNITPSTQLSLIADKDATKCTSSLMYAMQDFHKSNDIYSTTSFAYMLNFATLNFSFIVKTLTPLISALICSIIIWSFLGTLAGLAADMTEGTPLGNYAISPTAIFSKVYKIAKAALKAYLGDPSEAKALVMEEGGNAAATVIPNAGGGGGGGGTAPRPGIGAGGSGANTSQSTGSGANTSQSSGSGANTSQSSGSGANTSQSSGSGANTPQSSGSDDSDADSEHREGPIDTMTSEEDDEEERRRRL